MSVSAASESQSASWSRGSGGPITLAPVTHAGAAGPSSPPHSSSTSAADSVRVARRGLDERAVPARPHELGGLRAAERARLGDGVLGLGRVVDPVDREPVVVVDALGAVRRGARAELPAHLQRRLDLVVVEPHERVPEAVRAAVALVAGLGGGAELDRHRRALALDLRRDRGHEAVRVAGRAAGVVGARAGCPSAWPASASSAARTRARPCA